MRLTVLDSHLEKYRDPIHFYLNLISPEVLTSKHEIVVTSKNEVQLRGSGGAYLGIYYTPNVPRYEIGLCEHTLSKNEINPLEALAHEIVHLKQDFVGDLYREKIEGVRHVYWKGRHLGISAVYARNTPHDEIPWEIEARQLQGYMYQRYLALIGGF